jgi:hypothetical protein
MPFLWLPAISVGMAENSICGRVAPTGRGATASLVGGAEGSLAEEGIGEVCLGTLGTLVVTTGAIGKSSTASGMLLHCACAVWNARCFINSSANAYINSSPRATAGKYQRNQLCKLSRGLRVLRFFL